MESNNKPKKEYKYITITQYVQSLDLNDFEHLSDSVDLELTEDDSLDVFIRISQMRNLKEMEYLVLKLMGYEFYEMSDVLGADNMNKVYQIGNHMKSNFGKISKEKTIF